MRGLRLPLLLCSVAALIGGVSPAANPPPGGEESNGTWAEVLWEARFERPASDRDKASAIAVSPDGSTVFVTGTDYITFAYDAMSGEVKWSVHHDAPISLDDIAVTLAVSPDSSIVFVSGRSHHFDHCDSATVALDAATGAELWNARFGEASSHDYPRSIAIDEDGSTLFVSGYSSRRRAPSGYSTLAYDPLTGDEIWTATHRGSHAYRDDTASLAIDPSGSTVYVAGYEYAGPTGLDYTVLAYDAATGEELWSVCDDWNWRTDIAHAVSVSLDGATVFVTGHSYIVWPHPLSISCAYATAAYDASTGRQLWHARYGDSTTDSQGRTVAAGLDGASLFVTGVSAGRDTSLDFATVAYDAASGAEKWVARYDGPRSSDDEARFLALTPDGKAVVVTGYSTGYDTGRDYTTVAYDPQTGAMFWLARYDGPVSGDDEALSLAIAPDGWRVFVTGCSDRGAGDTDYATVAYAIGLPVAIDIAPGVFPNLVKQATTIGLALLGSETFDVTEVDTASIRFGPGQAECLHDLSDPFVYNSHLIDVNLDGRTDLLLHFGPDAGITCQVSEALLTSRLQSGRPIRGFDSVTVQGCPPRQRPF